MNREKALKILNKEYDYLVDYGNICTLSEAIRIAVGDMQKLDKVECIMKEWCNKGLLLNDLYNKLSKVLGIEVEHE